MVLHFALFFRYMGLVFPMSGVKVVCMVVRKPLFAIAPVHAHVDWRETLHAHLFHAELPGARKEDVKVEVEDGNILNLSGMRETEKEDESYMWHRVERLCGSYVRLFRLTENVNLDEIKCGFEYGLLTVIFPKKEVDQQQTTQTNVRNIDVT